MKRLRCRDVDGEGCVGEDEAAGRVWDGVITRSVQESTTLVIYRIRLS